MITQLSYTPDSAHLFAQVAHEPWAIFLDSGNTGGQDGRYDVIAARPFVTVVTQDGVTVIHGPDGQQTSDADPFLLLQQVMQRYPDRLAYDLPFTGGALGYFSYDLARCIEALPTLAQDAEHLTQMAVGLYDWAIVVDHEARKTTLVGQGHDPVTAQRWESLIATFSQSGTPRELAFSVTSDVRSNLDFPAYAKAFRQVQAYIQAGDCYQVNLAQRFCAEATGDGWTAYRALRKISPAPFAAYLRLPQAEILSASPERFLRVRDGMVETKPIKGTRPRAADPAEDRAQAEDLLRSPKDRAENLMIVDLLRNDIGKNCAVGSVKVERLFDLESFANVHHMVSTVRGKLAPKHDAVELLRGCFPGGSITGAPKLRAMEIIEELEPHRRGVYCGAIGYLGFNGNMDTNIAIRTAVFANGQIRFWAGGGLVADSEVDKEYRETLDKASSMLQLMEHFRVGA